MAAERSGTAPGLRPGAVLGAGVLGWLLWTWHAGESGRAPIRCGADFAPGADTVVMLSASWCGYCRRARDFLQSNAIEHCEYDIEKSAEGRRRFAALTLKAIPVMSIREDTLVGFDRNELMQTLAAHGLADPVD